MTVGYTFVGANIFMLLCVGSEQLFELSLVGNASETTSFLRFFSLLPGLVVLSLLLTAESAF